MQSHIDLAEEVVEAERVIADGEGNVEAARHTKTTCLLELENMGYDQGEIKAFLSEVRGG